MNAISYIFSLIVNKHPDQQFFEEICQEAGFQSDQKETLQRIFTSICSDSTRSNQVKRILSTLERAYIENPDIPLMWAAKVLLAVKGELSPGSNSELPLSAIEVKIKDFYFGCTMEQFDTKANREAKFAMLRSLILGSEIKLVEEGAAHS
ncbi:MAG: hypothetical protein ACOYK9_04160, partial [Chlamydiia bacterium]